MAESEIAHLRQQIAAEFAAAHRALHEYATVAKHEIITNRFNQAGLYTDELAHLVGKEEAMNIAAQVYMQVEAERTAQKEDAVVSELAPQVEEGTIMVKAHLKWEGAQFLRDHGCHIDQYATGDVITFPAGSRKAQLARTSPHYNAITLPDATEITSIDNDTTSVLLLIDLTNQQTIQLSI